MNWLKIGPKRYINLDLVCEVIRFTDVNDYGTCMYTLRFIQSEYPEQYSDIRMANKDEADALFQQFLKQANGGYYQEDGS